VKAFHIAVPIRMVRAIPRPLIMAIASSLSCVLNVKMYTSGRCMSRSNPTNSGGPREQVRKLRMREARVMVGMRESNGLFVLPRMTLVTRSMSRSARKAFCSCLRASFISSMSL